MVPQVTNRLISSRGDIKELPRGPNLTLSGLLLFLWGHLKHRVYADPRANLRQLKAHIQEEIAMICVNVYLRT